LLVVFLSACAIVLGACADRPAPNYGSINVDNYVRGAGAVAGFFTQPDPCTTVESLDRCELVECVKDDSGRYASAGTLTIVGTRELISLAPSPDGAYGTFQSQNALYAGGETLTFSAAGSDVPAFTGNIIAPAQMQIMSATVLPPGPGDFDPVIEKSQDFIVTWAAPTFGTVEIMMADPVLEHQLRCRFETSAGTATIPAATLMKLRTNLGWFAVGTLGTSELVAGDWSVKLRAGYEPTWSGGVTLSGQVAFH
jgi:hypothetical protein